MVPCIGAVRESPDAAAPPLEAPERRGAFFFAAPPPSPPSESPPGRTTSSRLPPTSTMIRLPVLRLGSLGAVDPAYGSIVLSNSVSIQRVCTRERLLEGERGVGDDGAVEGGDGRHALDDELVERAAGPLDGLRSGWRR